MKITTIILFLVIMAHCCISFGAGFPYTLNYQGTLQSNTGQPITQPQNITFSLYTTPIGTSSPFWSETLSNVPMNNGQFSVTLGTVTPLDPSKFSGDTYLGVKVGAQTEMLPRQKMTSVPYAFNGVPKGGVIMWSGAVNQIPSGWALCDGNNGTPNLRDRFIVGAGSSYTPAATGGEAAHTLTIAEMPAHSHPDAGHNHNNGGYDRLLFHNGYNTSATTDNTDPNGFEPNLTSSAVIATGYANIQNTGGNQPHNNLPPYYALAFIMKL